MAPIIDFVDKIDAAPSTRLDLDDGVIWRTALEGSDFSPPPMRRSTSTNMLSDGDYISASAYSNRRIVLDLQLVAANADGVGEHIQNLVHEIDRPTNFLRIQRDGASQPLFFRTLRSPIDQIREQLLTHRRVRAAIHAEPFALGLRETSIPTAITNDPATGCYLDVPYPKGDVETPLYIDFTASHVIAAGGRQSSMAMRRRGTPANMPFIIQAENMTLGTNTTLPGADATASGAGSNYARSTSLPGTFATRLTSAVFPSSPSIEARGKFRPVGRFRKTNAAGEVRVRLAISPDGTNDIIPDSVGVVLPTDTVWRWVEFPVIQVPVGHDPVTDGPNGVDLATRGIIYKIQYSLTASTSNIDCDCLVLMPADDRYCRVSWPSVSGPTTMRLDSSNRPKVYGLGASGETYSTMPPGLDSGTPLVSPNAYNRMWFLLDTGTTSTAGDAIANSTTVTWWYHPRYLSTNRPASS